MVNVPSPWSEEEASISINSMQPTRYRARLMLGVGRMLRWVGMDELKLTDVWTPSGLILGFQVILFSWRLAREASVGDEGDIPWLTPADYLNLLGMLVLAFGVYLLPMTKAVSPRTAAVFCGLGVLLFVGYVFSLAAHYQLFNRSKPRQFVWFPAQERVVVSCTAALGNCIAR
jgi:hypothetical protein